VYGVIDGKDIAPQADTTGQACTDQIQAVQAQLDQADTAKREAAVSGAEDALWKAADTAGFYASQNFVDGLPSLSGLSSSDLDGVAITGNTGQSAQLRATANGTCRTAQVAADGALGESTSC
jgi:hypothetical protein